ncbi:hypothetical protein TNCV_1013541 [Trichonephila clavipes]|uniref:Uncharacterized protein n=1 Tax=Trichonephila clavipes TaxID=2585209 RepID=A0A8X6VXI2_TRICX|nr:hypothetical protein TNCV_1013541 [Trichonephila clavipes]
MNLCGTRTPPPSCFSIEVKVFWRGDQYFVPKAEVLELSIAVILSMYQPDIAAPAPPIFLAPFPPSDLTIPQYNPKAASPTSTDFF